MLALPVLVAQGTPLVLVVLPLLLQFRRPSPVVDLLHAAAGLYSEAPLQLQVQLAPQLTLHPLTAMLAAVAAVRLVRLPRPQRGRACAVLPTLQRLTRGRCWMLRRPELQAQATGCCAWGLGGVALLPRWTQLQLLACT